MAETAVAQELARWTLEINCERELPEDLLALLRSEVKLLIFNLEDCASTFMRQRGIPGSFNLSEARDG